MQANELVSVIAGGEALFQRCEITVEASVQARMPSAVKACTGTEVLRSNAGAHWRMQGADPTLDILGMEPQP